MTIDYAGNDLALKASTELLKLLDRIAHLLGCADHTLATDGSLRITALLAWDRANEIIATYPAWASQREVLSNATMIYLGHTQRFLHKAYQSSLNPSHQVTEYTASQITGWLRSVADDIQRWSERA